MRKDPEYISPNMTGGKPSGTQCCRAIYVGLFCTTANDCCTAELNLGARPAFSCSDVCIQPPLHALRLASEATQQPAPGMPHLQRNGAALPAQQVSVSICSVGQTNGTCRAPVSRRCPHHMPSPHAACCMHDEIALHVCTHMHPAHACMHACAFGLVRLSLASPAEWPLVAPHAPFLGLPCGSCVVNFGCPHACPCARPRTRLAPCRWYSWYSQQKPAAAEVKRVEEVKA